MMVTDHHHALCDTCGQPTRFKQWPIRCECPTMSAGRSTRASREHIEEIWAEQEQKNAALPDPERTTPADSRSVCDRASAQNDTMSARQGWIFDNPPSESGEWHTPAWVKEGEISHFLSAVRCPTEHCRYGDGTCLTHSRDRTQ